MNALLIGLAVIAVVLLFIGGFAAASLKFLLFIGVVLLVVAVIAWVLRALTSRRS